MKWYREGYSVVGLMPNGKWQRFATDKEYRECYEDYLKELKR